MWFVKCIGKVSAYHAEICTYVAHHELESVSDIIITIIIISFIVISYYCYYTEMCGVMLQYRCTQTLAVDIHPAATIGKGVLLDHGTGLVIGETAVVGNNVSILHNVTLGGASTSMIMIYSSMTALLQPCLC